jgi:hypothetical protein
MARRSLDVFNLSFLDVMSCGFGAVVLFFIVLSALSSRDADRALAAQSTRAADLRGEVLLAEREQAGTGSALQALRDELARARAEATALLEKSTSDEERLAALERERERARERLEAIARELRAAERTREQLAATPPAPESGADLRRRAGDGTRQYLTGLRLGGDRVLFLVDTSASMLDDTLVNIIRRKNMSPERRREAPKWRRVIDTVDWLTARMTPGGKFQLYTFDVTARPVLPDTTDRWVDVVDGSELTRAVDALRSVTPEGGTSLSDAIDVVRRLTPPPDNVYLIVDGLPTRGPGAGEGTTISAAKRLEAFRRAAKRLPSRVPINVILLPLEGDPDAAAAYWELAQGSGGSFLNPSADWP